MTETALIGCQEVPDVLYEEAVAFVQQTRDPRCATLQRKFKLGYERALQLKERMQAAGIYDGIAPLVEPEQVHIKVIVLGRDAARTATLVKEKVTPLVKTIALETCELAACLSQADFPNRAAGLSEAHADALTVLQRCAPDYLARLRELVNAGHLLVIAGECEQSVDQLVAHALIQLARDAGVLTVSVLPGAAHESSADETPLVQTPCPADLAVTFAFSGPEPSSAGAPAAGLLWLHGLTEIVRVFARIFAPGENMITISFCDVKLALRPPCRGVLGIGQAFGSDAPMLAAEHAFAALGKQGVTKEHTRAWVRHVAISESAGNGFKFKPLCWIPEPFRCPEITHLISIASSQKNEEGVTVYLLALIADGRVVIEDQ